MYDIVCIGDTDDIKQKHVAIAYFFFNKIFALRHQFNDDSIVLKLVKNREFVEE